MCCREAVERTYHGLRHRRQTHDRALRAAVIVFRWQHPERSVSEAMAQIEAWIGVRLH